jgi:hypothetical protein
MAEEIIVTGYFSSTLPGFVRKSTGNKNEYLRGDNTWGTISSVPDLGDNSLLLGQIEAIPAFTTLGNNTGATGDVLALTRTQVRAMLGLPEVTWSMVRKTADSTFSTSTPADVPVGAVGSPYMTFSLTTARTYHFRYTLVVASSATNTGPAVAVTFPSGSTFAASVSFFGTQNGLDTFNLTTSDEPYIAKNVATANTNYMLVIDGMIVPNVSGSLALRARNELGNATVSVKRGSHAFLCDFGE